MSATAAGRGHGKGRSVQYLRQRGLVLLVAGAAILVLVRPLGPLGHVLDPLRVGLVNTAAAASTGRRSPLWGAGLVVAFWDLAQLLAGPLDLRVGPFATTMLGVGSLIAAFLATSERRHQRGVLAPGHQRGWSRACPSRRWPLPRDGPMLPR